MPKYCMTMDLQVLNHLGLNLYSNMPAVISEVVANAWDADAENVYITVVDNSEIVIFDDGCGMALEDINNKFLKVGYRKRNELAQTPIHKRTVMGRKGIGKLSLFSIARDITILSRKTIISLDGESVINKNALSISTDDLDAAIRSGTNNYTPKELDIALVDFEHDGTKIILRQLKKRTLNFSKYLKRRLARRFSVLGDKYKFNIYINDKEISVEDREYLSKAQYLWVYCESGLENDFLVQTKDNILKNHFVRAKTWEYNNAKYTITGWIATSEEPNALKDEDEAINRIAIMVRGKMAKEDILSEFSETGIYAKYVFGELYVEFLDQDSEIDITTSNRQDFFEDDERYLALKSFVKNELNHIKNKWIDLRNAIGTDEAIKIEVVREWYNELGPDDKKAAGKLFGKINQLTIDTSEKKELVRHGILAFETMKLKNCLGEFDSISPEDITAFIKAAETLNSIEATYYYKIVYERLSVIKKMKEVTDDNALEKVVQQHLAQNLWLLDPSWDRGTEIPIVEEAIKTQFNTINASLTQEEQEARLDVRYKKAANRHIIIELKRAGRVVKRGELFQQIMKYHGALTKIMATNKENEPFEIIVLLGKPIDNLDMSSEDYNSFIGALTTSYKTRTMYYKELIANAEKMYSDFLEKNREAEKVFERFITTPDE